jgi:hypothetical protein
MTKNLDELPKRSPTRLVSHPWFGGDLPDEHGSTGGRWIMTAVGLLIGGLIFWMWSHWLGAIVLTLALATAMVHVVAPVWGQTLNRGLDVVGHWAGRIAAYAVLVPIYLIGFTGARLYNRCLGIDPLLLRKSDEPTYWLPSDSDRRKRRYIRTMFTTERLAGRRVGGLLHLFSFGVLGLVLAEVGLRLAGFGSPILYLNDDLIGYMPVPSQRQIRSGGVVEINRFGMRAPDYSLAKHPHTIRILMLGDSTLYGGSYVDQSQLYARLLERELKTALAPVNVEVWNMGVNGWGPYHKLGYVEKYGTFKADMAIICLPIGDIYRTKYGAEPGGPLNLASAPPKLALSEIWLQGKARALPILRRIGLAEAQVIGAREPAQGRRGVAAYRQLVERLQGNGCEVYVEVLPSRLAGVSHEVPESELREVGELRVAVESTGAQFAFPAGIFANAGVPTDALYHDVCHLDITGHSLYSHYLKRRLLITSKKLAQAKTSDQPSTPRNQP